MVTVKFACDNCGRTIENPVTTTRKSGWRDPNLSEINAEFRDLADAGWKFFGVGKTVSVFCSACRRSYVAALPPPFEASAALEGER